MDSKRVESFILGFYETSLYDEDVSEVNGRRAIFFIIFFNLVTPNNFLS